LSRWEHLLLVSSFIPHVFILVCSSFVVFLLRCIRQHPRRRCWQETLAPINYSDSVVCAPSRRKVLLLRHGTIFRSSFSQHPWHTDTVWWRERGFTGVDRHAAWIQIYRSIKPMICDDGRDGMSRDALMGFQRRYCTRRRYSMVLEKTAPTAPLVGRCRKVNAGPRVYDEGLIDRYIPRSLLLRVRYVLGRTTSQALVYRKSTINRMSLFG